MKRFLLLVINILLVMSFTRIAAQDSIPDPMYPPRLVNDFANVFTESQQYQLEQRLRAYHDSTTTQIYVVTVNSLGGDAPYNYAASLGNKWGIGQKGKDNGVLILIKPKTNNERGQVFIAPGYGLEARLNDAFVGRVIDNEMIPYLQQNNDYYRATSNAVNEIIERIADEDFTGGEKNGSLGSWSWGDTFLMCILLPLFIILFIISPRFRSVVMFLLLLLFRGGGGRGGSSGGGFGGGGGGRFGGGGAGRSW